MKYFLAIAATAMILAAGVGCDRGESAPVSSHPPTASAGGADAGASDTLPATLVLTAAPADAKDVTQLRATAKSGDDVVIRGVVAGSKEPLAKHRAILTLLDPAIRTCDRMTGDTCKTPWDACCEPTDVLVANTATVQVVGPDGRPLKAGLEGVGGIQPLKRVVVVGKYRPSPDGKAAVVDATGLYVEP
jgi:hypothetical protein